MNPNLSLFSITKIYLWFGFYNNIILFREVCSINAILLKINGIVQGVGFRPYIYRLASKYKLTGWVKNTSDGIKLFVQGKDSKISKFIKDIKTTPPSLSKIESISIEKSVYDNNISKFSILDSSKEVNKLTLISPDVGICNDCIKDILDPLNRRYYYPFTNCTNCGPRFSIIDSLPYDRSLTSMNKFAMCSHCKNEYIEANNRRFHAEPNCCPTCGPFIYILSNKGELISSSNSPINTCKYNVDTIKLIANLLQEGKIIAIKGIGGFHLCCNALNYKSIERLRSTKKRNAKPLALMAKDIYTIKEYCTVSKLEEELLKSSSKPIVLLKKKINCTIPNVVSPNNSKLGFMLPYTPLYILIFENINFPLVVTSGNISSLPLCYDNSTALDLLSNNCDYFVMNNRDINIGIDDSLMTVFNNKEYMIRRARGYAPTPFKFNDINPIIATGANMKNTFSIGKNNYIFLSQHIGDIDNYETLEHYKHSLNHYMKAFNFNPKYVACDLHPNYDSTKVALSLNLKTFHIQHHHAHIASCMYENNINENVIGIAFDGTGYGIDGSIWGSEFLISNLKTFKKVASLDFVPLIGGDSFIKDCYKSALSHLYNLKNKDIKFFYKHNIDTLINNKYGIKGNEFFSLIEQNIYPIKTSSMGRLFDAVSSLLGICNYSTYEGQAPIELESFIAASIDDYYSTLIEKSNNLFLIRSHEILKGIILDLENNTPVNIISAKFHNSLAKVILDTCLILRKEYSLNKVILSGGVFQNMYLLNKAYNLLTEYKFHVFTHNMIPSNDAGISVGQILIANSLINS